MISSRFAVLPLLLLLLGLVPASAQDTRGSLVPDDLVLLADGTEVHAGDLRPGALLRSGTGPAASVKVTAVRKQHTDSYYLLAVGGRELHATGSHRIARADGTLVRLDTLKVGDRILVLGPGGTEADTVRSIRILPATLVAIDLTVEGHRPFVAAGVVVGD